MKKLLKKILLMLTQHRFTLSPTMTYMGRDRKIDVYYDEYIRVSSLELVSEEINNKKISGAVAELGVYQGEFAKYINQLFPDRRFYLFDTFQGFDEKDLKTEKNNDYTKVVDDFANTSVELVLRKMKFKENIIIKKGFFPKTAEGVQDNFCFVSIDCDLYDPIYEGLNYFYPRLQKGGYIFVHDYNNDLYKGAKQAVRNFCKENNISYLPLTDTCGSAILMK